MGVLRLMTTIYDGGDVSMILAGFRLRIHLLFDASLFMGINIGLNYKNPCHSSF